MIKNNLVVLFVVCIVAVIFSRIMITVESAKSKKDVQPAPVLYSAETSASRVGEYAYLEDHLYVKTDSLCYPRLYCWVHIVDDCKGCNRAKK